MNKRLKVQRQKYERKLTVGNIEKAMRFLTQLVEGLQFEGAIKHLATRKLRGKPFSNSILLHELREAEEWEKLGYDFASERLGQMNDDERLQVRGARNRAYKDNPVPHYLGMWEQYDYLACVAGTMGFDVSPGTMVYMSMFTTCKDIEQFAKYDPAWKHIESEIISARDFMLSLASAEPEYAAITLEGIRLSYKPDVPTPLYANYESQIEQVVALHRTNYETK